MKLSYIKDQLAVIKYYAFDAELAHSAEDTLYREFVAFIAEHGTTDQAEMAKELLTSADIDFTRWCA